MIDARNHGESDHHNDMSYKAMAEDIARYADKKNINKFTLLGHSMGGKTAMTFATLFPDRLDGLIVVDAPPQDNSKITDFTSKTSEVVINFAF